jgi:uncharacterized membrane protein YedE/YeeE
MQFSTTTWFSWLSFSLLDEHAAKMNIPTIIAIAFFICFCLFTKITIRVMNCFPKSHKIHQKWHFVANFEFITRYNQLNTLYLAHDNRDR